MSQSAPHGRALQRTGERVAYYRRAMPEGHRFWLRPIAADMLDPADRGNAQFVEARDRQGRTVGYLRDFTGPVSPAAQCPCNPLSLTLVFNADFSLRTLLSPQPLQKYGHAPMSAAEVARLIAILRAPPPALQAIDRVEDMVDITTGATQRALSDVVVPQAALSTRRLLGIVQQSQRILQGAPGDAARGLLNTLVQRYRTRPAKLAGILADWLQHLSHDAPRAPLRQDIWHILGRTYEASQQAAAATPQPAVIAQLVGPELLGTVAADAIAHVALRLARTPHAAPALAQAVQTLAAAPPGAVPAALLAQVRGTAAMLAGEPQAALPELQRAVAGRTLDDSPELHLYLAQAFAQLDDRPQACGLAQALYRRHPRLPGVQQSLNACLDGPARAPAAREAGRRTLAQALRQEEKACFLATVRDAEAAAGSPTLALQRGTGRSVQFTPAHADKLTVLVFFATWCPHCRAELPQIRAFVAGLNATQRAQVRVVAVRTAKERETSPYAQFTREFAPNFPIYTDATMSGGFAEFAQSHDLSRTLPTTVVLDTAGRLRVAIEPGDFRDIAEELRWAVEALAPHDQQAHLAPLERHHGADAWSMLHGPVTGAAGAPADGHACP